jgi:hypothetical protein
VLDHLGEIVIVLCPGRTIAMIVIWHCDRVSEADQLFLDTANEIVHAVGLGAEHHGWMRSIAFWH